jgi:hypothetical protein
LAAVLLLGAALTKAPTSNATENDTNPTALPADDDRSASPQANLRVREGTEIVNQLGYFRITGGRVLFSTADGKRRFVGLENLNLERVARAIAGSPQTLQWDVTGTITEYRGANFLLVRRAVLKRGGHLPAARF